MRPLTVMALVAIAGCRGNAQAPIQVTLDPLAEHQTIRWWSCNPWYAGIAPRLQAMAQLTVGDRVSVRWYVNDHLRIEEVGPLR